MKTIFRPLATAAVLGAVALMIVGCGGAGEAGRGPAGEIVVTRNDVMPFPGMPIQFSASLAGVPNAQFEWSVVSGQSLVGSLNLAGRMTIRTDAVADGIITVAATLSGTDHRGELSVTVIAAPTSIAITVPERYVAVSHFFVPANQWNNPPFMIGMALGESLQLETTLEGFPVEWSVAGGTTIDESFFTFTDDGFLTISPDTPVSGSPVSQIVVRVDVPGTALYHEVQVLVGALVTITGIPDEPERRPGFVQDGRTYYGLRGRLLLMPNMAASGGMMAIGRGLIDETSEFLSFAPGNFNLWLQIWNFNFGQPRGQYQWPSMRLITTVAADNFYDFADAA